MHGLRCGLVTATVLALAAGAPAEEQGPDLAKIEQELLAHAGQLRSLGRLLETHARTPASADLDAGAREEYESSLEALAADGKAALALADRIEASARKAHQRAFIARELESLAPATERLAARIRAQQPEVATRGAMDRRTVNQRLKELEAQQESVRNKRQLASTAFQNFDQKSNQLYNLLSSVMKSLNEMRRGTVRNMR